MHTTTTTVDPVDVFTFVEAKHRDDVFRFAEAENAATARRLAAQAERSRLRTVHGMPAPRVVAAPSIQIGSAISSTGERCQYAGLIRSVWQQDAEWAVGIAYRESNCRPEVASSENARGIFQLLGHVGDACAYDAACNINAAWQLYQQCGRWPWTAPNYGCRKP